MNTEAPGALHVNDADYETIKNVNLQVNSDHDYKTDQSGYGVGENWAIMGEGETGDCEDFALTKMQALIDAEFNVKNLQLAWGQTETGGNHAFLVIQTSNRGTLVLDNRFANVMKIENVPYRFQAYQRAGQSWAGYSARLTGVSIEYMTCNAAAFADGDQVIIEFESQDWNSPKVIGFKSDPTGCIGSVLVFYSDYSFGGAKLKAYGYDFITGSFAAGGEYSDVYITGFAHSAHVVGERKGHFIGGRVDPGAGDVGERNLAKDYNIEYVMDTEAYSQKAVLPTPRAFGTAINISHSIYVIGGAKYGGFFFNDNEKYTIAANAWSAAQDHLYEAWYIDGFQLSGKGYVVGGLDGDQAGGGNKLNDNLEYDPDGDSWASKEDYPVTSIYGISAFADYDTNKGYVIGGITVPAFDAFSRAAGATSYYTQRCYQYDPVTDGYARKADYLNQGYILIFDPFLGTWIRISELAADTEGDGPYARQGAGGRDYGAVVQMELGHAAYYNAIPMQSYKPSTDTWEQQSFLPDGVLFSQGYVTLCDMI